jgi:hypothetical protein
MHPRVVMECLWLAGRSFIVILNIFLWGITRLDRTSLTCRMRLVAATFMRNNF